jgi:hypothetical protein
MHPASNEAGKANLVRTVVVDFIMMIGPLVSVGGWNDPLPPMRYRFHLLINLSTGYARLVNLMEVLLGEGMYEFEEIRFESRSMHRASAGSPSPCVLQKPVFFGS